MKHLYTLLTLLIVSLISSAQVMVDQTVLLNEIPNMFLGDDYEISNVTFSGDLEQIGIVFGNGTNLGMELGLGMATGDISFAANVGNTNTAGSDGGGNIGAADPDLESMTGLLMHDAAILEFDFVANSEVMSFEYIFASEEYPEFACSSFNDAFGFFLSGPGIDGEFQNNAVNIATIPNSEPPAIVSIDNINNASCGVDYVDYYVDNLFINNPDPLIVEYDGFTVLMPAEISVEIGQTYHLKLAIADASDTSFDSAVFIRSATSAFIWTDSEGEVDEGGLPLFNETLLTEGCFDGEFNLYLSYAASSTITDISLSGEAVMGVDYEDVSEFLQIPEDFVGIHTIPINTITDDEDEGPESVILSLTYMDEFGDSITVSEELSIADGNEALNLEVEPLYRLCNEETILIEVTTTTGTGEVVYEWSDGTTASTNEFGPDQAGTHSVTLTDDCDNSLTQDFVVILAEPLEVIEEQLICTGEPSLEFIISGEAPFTYTYDEANLSEEDGIFSSTNAGDYMIGVEDDCGNSDEVQLSVASCTSVDEENAHDFTILQTENGLLITSSQLMNRVELRIYNSNGQLVNSYKNITDGTLIQLSDLASGVYTVSLSNQSQILQTQKIVK